MAGGEDTECPDVLLGDMSVGRLVRPLAGGEGQVPDPEGGNAVESETPAQVIGLVEAAVFDAGAGLQRMEEPLARFPRSEGGEERVPVLRGG